MVSRDYRKSAFRSRRNEVEQYRSKLNMTRGAEQVIRQMPHAIWRGNQMASYQAPTLASGFGRLDAQLPHAGWPQSALIELLIQQPGIGEIQLLKPALVNLSSARHRRIAFIQPPHLLHIAAFQSWGISIGQLLWIKTKQASDALWATEQILRNGSCGAVVVWQTHVHSNALRRLHLAAQETATTCWLVRPLLNTQEASPAPLRLALRPASGGIEIDLIKRRGPPSSASFYVLLPDMPAISTNTNFHHAIMDRRTPAITSSRNIPAALV
jgi:protein ImuA